ncbi:MAG: nucleoside diphosphate kinase regulator [Bdellovibrionaceae bacterium]|nr:nucleoside diphosphate kinase regulator [Pseudobdellovibrionaceae bacterium]
MQSPTLFMTQSDVQKISSLLPAASPEIRELLTEEIARAEVVPEDQLPPGVATMNSEIRFVDLDTHQERTVTLVYPADASAQLGRISIFAPIGAALIGLSEGQSIDWPLESGVTKHLRVLSVR